MKLGKYLDSKPMCEILRIKDCSHSTSSNAKLPSASAYIALNKEESAGFSNLMVANSIELLFSADNTFPVTL